jgi:hypothetical protein
MSYDSQEVDSSVGRYRVSGATGAVAQEPILEGDEVIVRGQKTRALTIVPDSANEYAPVKCSINRATMWR